MVDVSIIIPIYYNEFSLEKTIDTIKTVVVNKNPDLRFEIICVDDGSKDGSYTVLKEIQSKNNALIKLIKFSRNFGQVYAMLAAYKKSSGQVVINISADLQDPPELMNEMIQIHLNEGIPIVIGTRSERDESLYRKKTSSLFYGLMRKLSFSEMPEGGFDYALLSRKVVDIIVESKETNPFWQGQILWSGFSFKLLPYKRLKRDIGESKWTFSRKVKYLIDGVLGYSYLPLRAISVFGGILFLLGLIYAGIIVVAYFTGNVPFKGWAPIMITMLVLFGIVMLMLGIIGEYLWRVLDQVRQREKYIIEEEIDDTKSGKIN